MTTKISPYLFDRKILLPAQISYQLMKQSLKANNVSIYMDGIYTQHLKLEKIKDLLFIITLSTQVCHIYS